MHSYNIINHVIALNVQRCNVTTIIKTLTTFPYRGKYHAFQFTSQLHHLFSKISLSELHYHNIILKKHTLNTLHEPYESIAKNFFLMDEPYTIYNIFHAIMKEYNYHHKQDIIKDLFSILFSSKSSTSRKIAK